MDAKLHFLIIEDDEVALEDFSRLIKKGGHEVNTLTSSANALEKINELRPDCILCDLLLPGLDGLDLFQLLKEKYQGPRPSFIIITGKQYEFDYRHALELGVDGYIHKPINRQTFLDELENILNCNISIRFWGCRGSLTIPGAKTVKYGGNTNCITLSIGNKHYLIFDAGTGIKELSNFLIKENKFPLKAKIFLTHPHYDHICGLPFFVPLYMKGNQFEILGPDQANCDLENTVGNQMDSIYFPVTMKEFSAQLTFRALTEQTLSIDDIKINTIYLNHPGRCLGYRIEYKNKSFSYITDNELYLENSPFFRQSEVERLVNFIKDTDVLVIDSTYRDEEYPRKIGWGHSCVTSVVDIADKAKVKLLCLHHHDPDQTDDDIDKKLKEATQLLKSRKSKTRCIAPHEGDKLVL